MFKFSTLVTLINLIFCHSVFAAMPDNLPSQCKQLFQQTEDLIAEAEKQPGTHPQLIKIKNNLSESKQKILSMSVEHQIKSCDKGLVAFNNLKGKDD